MAGKDGFRNSLAYVSDRRHTSDAKLVDFHPSALEFIRTQPAMIRRQIGEALRDLQRGLSIGMPLSRPMSSIASGVHELRVKGEDAVVRVFYCLHRADAVLVFHAIRKRSRKTPRREIELARKRLREML